jgi:MoxR-like ATPase
MKPSAITTALRALTEVRQSVFIWGGPGIGKSAMVRQVTAAAGLPLRDIRALLLDPVDLRGLPFLGTDGRAKWAAPDFLPSDGCGILFLDELNAAPAMVQAACYQLGLDRSLGEYRLPEGWAIVAAGNREGDRGATTRMPAPLRNRFVHLDFELDGEEWSRWAIKTGIRAEVIAFLRFRPELLSVFDRDAHAFPSPRSWEFVSRMKTQLRAPHRTVPNIGVGGNLAPARDRTLDEQPTGGVRPLQSHNKTAYPGEGRCFPE